MRPEGVIPSGHLLGTRSRAKPTCCVVECSASGHDAFGPVEPGAALQHTHIRSARTVVVVQEVCGGAHRGDEHAGCREMGTDLRVIHHSLLVRSGPQHALVPLPDRHHEDGHDAGLGVVHRMAHIPDRLAVEDRIPGEVAPLLTALQISGSDEVHDELTTLLERRDHAGRDLLEQREIRDISERIAEQHRSVARHVRSPFTQITHVQLDPRIAPEETTSFCHTGV